MVRERDWGSAPNQRIRQWRSLVPPPLCDLTCDLPVKALAPIVVAYKADFALRKSLILLDANGGCGGQ